MKSKKLKMLLKKRRSAKSMKKKSRPPAKKVAKRPQTTSSTNSRGTGATKTASKGRSSAKNSTRNAPAGGTTLQPNSKGGKKKSITRRWKALTQARKKRNREVVKLKKSLAAYIRPTTRTTQVQKADADVNQSQKAAFIALNTAIQAAAAAGSALVATLDEAEAPKTEAPKKKKAETPAETPAAPAVETPKAPASAAVVETPKAAPASDDILDKCRAAAQEYASVYGREGLRKVLDEFTKKTLADVPADKLPELLKKLS